MSRNIPLSPFWFHSMVRKTCSFVNVYFIVGSVIDANIIYFLLLISFNSNIRILTTNRLWNYLRHEQYLSSSEIYKVKIQTAMMSSIFFSVSKYVPYILKVFPDIIIIISWLSRRQWFKWTSKLWLGKITEIIVLRHWMISLRWYLIIDRSL